MSASLRIAGAAAVVAASGTGAALAQTPVTVKALLDQEFQVVGTVASHAGPGMFLQKKDKLFFCVVAETATSPDVATRYCKPVR
jgi:H+/gluconate symporter-like permease